MLILVLFDLASLEVVSANGWVLTSYEEKPAEQVQSAYCLFRCYEALVHNALLQINATKLTIPAACVQHVPLSVHKRSEDRVLELKDFLANTLISIPLADRAVTRAREKGTLLMHRLKMIHSVGMTKQRHLKTDWIVNCH